MKQTLKSTEKNERKTINKQTSTIMENYNTDLLKKISSTLTSLSANTKLCQSSLNINDIKTASFFLEQISSDRDEIRECLKELVR